MMQSKYLKESGKHDHSIINYLERSQRDWLKIEEQLTGGKK